MNNEPTMQLITQRLTHVFHPELLNVLDESHKHVGHPGAKNDRGHFKIEIKSDSFKSQSRINSHRQIYQALADLMQTKIHALIISIL